MTYDQYWYGDPYMVHAYLEAQKFRLEQLEYEYWLQGAYTFKALQSALSVSEFFRAKGTRPTQYLNKPIGVWERQTPELMQERREKEAERERLAAIAYFDNVIKANRARRGE